MTTYTIKPLSREELQALRNMGNECEAAADEIDQYRAALEQIRSIIESDSELPYKQVHQIDKIVGKLAELNGVKG